jgi:phenylpropionate dioxygenase-like ring-hydroxylating dioxygenase large terminal subunit
MDTDTIRDVVKRLIEHVDNRTADYADTIMMVDSAIYVDPDLARRERNIFDTAPAVAGHLKEIPEPGHFLTVDLLGVPVLVVRQDDGSVQAFANVCRHRGARVEGKPSGRRKMFACPYHKWCYGRDGSIRSMPFDDGFAALDRSDYGLQKLPTAELFGLIWVAPTPDSKRDLLADMRADLGEDLINQLQGFGISKTWMFRQRTFSVAINWKVVLEGFLDPYHLQFVHPETVGPFFHTNIYTFEPYGKHGRILVARRGIEEIRDKDPSTFNFRRYVATNYTLYPSTVIVPAPEHFEVWTILPDTDDPTRSRVTVRIAAPFADATDKQQRYLEKNWELLCYALEKEDWEVSGTIMPGAKARVIDDLVLGRNEAPIQHFHRVLLADLGDQATT